MTSLGATSQRPIAVVGATGLQGGATVRALLGANALVRALARRTDSDAAHQRPDRGVRVQKRADGGPALEAGCTDHCDRSPRRRAESCHRSSLRCRSLGGDAFGAGEMRRQELPGPVQRRGRFVEDLSLIHF